MHNHKSKNRKLIFSIGLINLILLLVNIVSSPYNVTAANTHSIDLERDSSQYLSISDGSQTGLDVTGDLTIESWVKVETAPSSQIYAIASKYDSPGNQRSYVLYYRDVSGTKRLYFAASSNGQGGGAVERYVDTSLGTGTWHHVAVVYTASGGTADFYVDGTQVGSQQTGYNTSIHSGSAMVEIGSTEVDHYFDGILDDVRIWNIARTNQEISDDMSRELNGNETGLVGYWKLNNSLTDTTSNGNTLTNNNSASFSATSPFSGFTELLKVRKTTNESVTSSTVLQNDDQLKLSLDVNKSYIVDGVLFASSTSATPDIIIAFFGASDVELTVGYTNDVNEMVLDSGDPSTRIALPANTPTSIHIKGTVKTSSTSGDFQLKWSQATSNAAATTVMKGSYLRAEAI